MNLTPLESLVLSYVQNHMATSRKTVVEVLGDGDWQRQKRVRAALDTLAAHGLILKSVTKPVRYAVPQKFPTVQEVSHAQ